MRVNDISDLKQDIYKLETLIYKQNNTLIENVH